MNTDHAVIAKKLARGGFASPAKFAKDIQTALDACRDYNGDAEDGAEFLQLADKVPATSQTPTQPLNLKSTGLTQNLGQF